MNVRYMKYHKCELRMKNVIDGRPSQPINEDREVVRKSKATQRLAAERSHCNIVSCSVQRGPDCQ